MNGRSFAQKRARILAQGRSDKVTRRAIAHLAREAGAEPVIIARKTVGYQMRSGVTVCDKRRYATEGEAVLELYNVQAFAHLSATKKPVRAYACPHCRGWHMTSQKGYL